MTRIKKENLPGKGKSNVLRVAGLAVVAAIIVFFFYVMQGGDDYEEVSTLHGLRDPKKTADSSLLKTPSEHIHPPATNENGDDDRDESGDDGNVGETAGDDVEETNGDDDAGGNSRDPAGDEVEGDDVEDGAGGDDAGAGEGVGAVDDAAGGDDKVEEEEEEEEAEEESF